MVLKVGDKAPAIQSIDQDGKEISLSHFLGKKVALYFYPKDDTPGCTKEACMIAEVYKDFEKKDVTVFGVSKDSPKSHLKFAEKYNLPFTLLSDPEATMIQKYEAWKEKSMFGKKYMGIDRITYVIDPNGKIAKVYEKVDPASHALQILADIKLLQAG
jgi:peroxiredoxin Q/BCP